jgi:hypothetical protein
MGIVVKRDLDEGSKSRSTFADKSQTPGSEKGKVAKRRVVAQSIGEATFNQATTRL